MNIGFVGAGNMGGAIIKGYLGSDTMKAGNADSLFVYDSERVKAEALKADGLAGIKVAENLKQLVECCEVLILCVKPNVMGDVLDELAEQGAGNEKLIISIAAGISISFIKAKLGEGTRVIRVMPNTPAMVGEGMSAMSASEGITAADADISGKLFSALGRVIVVPEELMDTVTGISGSSPAYAYLYIEGLVNAGIDGGLSKEDATIMAAQSTLGAAKMVLENLGKVDPRQLCVNVCSPGGTTIEAVKVFEEAGFTELVSKAAKASAEKSKLITC
jgi:pyrroline-5-carboxylate reductase